MAGRLERPRRGKLIAGVCAGIAEHYGWNVTLLRLLFVVFAFTGAGEIVYLALWLIMPKARR